MSLARVEAAVPLFKEALAGRQRLFGDSSWLTFSTESNLALATGETAPPEHSLATLRALLERARTLSDPPRYTILGLHNNVGATLLDLGRPAQARPHLAAALELVNGLLDVDHASVLQIRANLASLDADLGQAEHGFAEYQDIAERFARTLGPGAEDTLHARHGVWSCAAKAGRWNDAAAGFEKLLDDVVASVSAGHPLVAQTQHSLANALRRDGRLAAALPHARAAAAAFLARYGVEHPRSKATAALQAEIEAGLAAMGVR